MQLSSRCPEVSTVKKKLDRSKSYQEAKTKTFLMDRGAIEIAIKGS